MTPPRVVPDTNVVVSAALKRGGLEDQVVQLVATRQLVLCASAATMAEYEGVLSRPKFAQIDPERIARLLAALKREAVIVVPALRVSKSSHEPDNRFLECAEAAMADYLVTGNLRHFPKRWKSTRVVNARQFLEMIGKERRRAQD
jgi:uncharacterized protein